MSNATTSVFSRVLRDLLDATHARAEWALILGVTPSAISQWVNDQSIPRPEHLRALWTTLLEDRRVPSEQLERFAEVMQQRASEVSPHGQRMGQTIGHYTTRPLRKGFMRALDSLPPHAQERVLLEASDRCRLLRQQDLEPPSVEEQRHEMFEGFVDALSDERHEGTGSSPSHAASARRHALGEDASDAPAAFAAENSTSLAELFAEGRHEMRKPATMRSLNRVLALARNLLELAEEVVPPATTVTIGDDQRVHDLRESWLRHQPQVEQ